MVAADSFPNGWVWLDKSSHHEYKGTRLKVHSTELLLGGLKTLTTELSLLMCLWEREHRGAMHCMWYKEIRFCVCVSQTRFMYMRVHSGTQMWLKCGTWFYANQYSGLQWKFSRYLKIQNSGLIPNTASSFDLGGSSFPLVLGHCEW